MPTTSSLEDLRRKVADRIDQAYKGSVLGDKEPNQPIEVYWWKGKWVSEMSEEECKEALD